MYRDVVVTDPNETSNTIVLDACHLYNYSTSEKHFYYHSLDCWWTKVKSEDMVTLIFWSWHNLYLQELVLEPHILRMITIPHQRVQEKSSHNDQSLDWSLPINDIIQIYRKCGIVGVLDWTLAIADNVRKFGLSLTFSVWWWRSCCTLGLCSFISSREMFLRPLVGTPSASLVWVKINYLPPARPMSTTCHPGPAAFLGY